MQVAVTGATGFVGGEVLRSLKNAGYKAVPLVRTARGWPKEVVTGDLADGAVSGSALAGCNAVIHLAARTHVMNETASDPMQAYRKVNVVGTAKLLDAAIAAGVKRFVYMSSVKAIGERSPPSGPLGPDSPPQPEDAYGKTKLEAEELVKQRCAEAGIEWAILRPPLIYGPGVKANFERLFKLVMSGVPLPFALIRNRRSLVDVKNLADAAVLAASVDGAANKAFMVCDVTLSTPDMIRAIGAAVSRAPRLVPVPPSLLALAGKVTGKSGVVERVCGSLELDATRTRQDLNWQPERTFEQSLVAIAAHLRKSDS